MSAILEGIVKFEPVGLFGDIVRHKTVLGRQNVSEERVAYIVVLDGAPDILGKLDFDQFIQHQNLIRVLNVPVTGPDEVKGLNFMKDFFLEKCGYDLN